VFSAVPAGEVRDLTSIYGELLEAGKLAAYEVPDRFYEIGSPEGLQETEQLLSKATTIGENPQAGVDNSGSSNPRQLSGVH
jgi:NDP-sugar pyrophosphorylase family protein